MAVVWHQGQLLGLRRHYDCQLMQLSQEHLGQLLVEFFQRPKSLPQWHCLWPTVWLLLLWWQLQLPPVPQETVFGRLFVPQSLCFEPRPMF
jgi:hypothetical protein